jgi:YidC/Oxa1 family membrane protein insertase
VLLDGPSADPKGGAYVSIVAELAGRDAPAAGQAVPEPDVQQVPPETAAKGDPEKSSVSKPENLWGGVKNRFYMAMLVSCDSAQLIRISAVPVANKINDPDKRLAEPNLGVLGTRRESAPLAAGATSAPDRYVLYMGPSNEAQLAAAETELALPQPVFLPTALRYCDMFNYSWPRVDWAARQMMTVFRALSYVFGNYGVAVILLTLLIKLALHPLQRKMMVSMNKMQKLQPELKKLQEKYKGQTSTQAKQRMFQEQQDIMRKGGASYSAGCLPMFVQLPILTALYGIFNRAFEMRGATFAWIQDLSQADRAFSLPFYPHELNLLPVIYAVLQLFQMRLTPQAPATDPQQEMQQTMMKYMPIMFSIMLYRMSSGLMLYFAASAVFGMVETWYIRKHLIKDLPGAATSNGKPPPAVVLTKAS